MKTAVGGALLALVLATFSACASSAGGSSADCRSDLAPAGESLNLVLDSADAQRRLEAVWPEGAGLVVASLAGVSENDSTPGAVWGESLEADSRAGLREVIELVSFMPPREVRSDRAYMVLGDSTGPSIRRVDRFAVCAPVILSRVSLMSRVAAEAAGLDIPQPLVVRVYAFVSEAGTVEELRVDESSGFVDVDRAVLRAFREARFTPRRVEGIPSAGWVSFPVTVRPSG